MHYYIYFLTDHFVHNLFIAGSVVFLVNETLFSNHQAYRIIISNDQITVVGASPVGAWYGLQTLVQLLKLFPPKDGVPQLTVSTVKSGVRVKYCTSAKIQMLVKFFTQLGSVHDFEMHTKGYVKHIHRFMIGRTCAIVQQCWICLKEHTYRW